MGVCVEWGREGGGTGKFLGGEGGKWKAVDPGGTDVWEDPIPVPSLTFLGSVQQNDWHRSEVLHWGSGAYP